MTKKVKLLEKVKELSPNLKHSEVMKVAKYIGFTNEGGAGSHTTMSREGEVVQLNFQKMVGGKAKPYQIKQLREMVLKYEHEINDK